MIAARRRALAALAFLFGAVLATFLLAGAHQHREATRRLDAANAAFVNKDYGRAADEAHAAALRAWPRSDVQREAFDMLQHTARSAGAAGDTATALVAWTEMRQAAIAVRSVLQDTTSWQREAEEGARAASGAASDLPGDDGRGTPSQGLRLATAAAVLLAVGGVALTRVRRRPAASPAPARDAPAPRASR